MPIQGKTHPLPLHFRKIMYFCPDKTQIVTHKNEQTCKKSADLREMKRHK
jgi:hypothetical protein